MKQKIYCLLLCILFFASCSKDQLELDNSFIKSYLLENDVIATEQPSGIFYRLTKEGIGKKTPDSLSNVTIEYKGYLTNNMVFDETIEGDAYTIPLVDLIEGLQEGIALLTEGAEATFFIPSVLGYGAATKAKIPPHAVLIFDIKLVEVE